MTQVLIMAVPWEQSRVKRAVELSRETGGQIVWDKDRVAFHTWRDVLRTAGDDPVIILEDDIELTENWSTKVEDVISDHPDDVIQFFSMRGDDVKIGSRREPGRTFLMNQCYYLPAGVARQLLDYTDDWEQRRPDEPTGYDIAMAEWMQRTKRTYWLHVPSLVQHKPWRSEIHPRRPRNRQSGTFQ